MSEDASTMPIIIDKHVHVTSDCTSLDNIDVKLEIRVDEIKDLETELDTNIHHNNDKLGIDTGTTASENAEGLESWLGFSSSSPPPSKSHRQQKAKRNSRKANFVENANYRCNLCHKLFSHTTQLRRHVVDSHLPPNWTETNYQCTTCQKSFTKLTVLNTHYKSHWDKKPYSCEFKGCDQSFITAKGLRLHRPFHSEVRPFGCAFCEQRFKGAHSLELHYRDHTGEKPVQCNICKKQFSRYTKLKSHLKVHQVPKGTPQCPQCFKTYIDEESLQKHSILCGKGSDYFSVEYGPILQRRGETVKHHLSRKRNRIYKCKLCSTVIYNHHHNMEEHILRAHLKVKLYNCGYCDMKFCHKTELTAHSRTHTNERPFACEQCGAQFKQSSSLNNHVYVVHVAEENTIKCPHCPTMFKTKEYLRSHIKIIHTKRDKPFQCDQCKKYYATKQCLTSHQRVHPPSEELQCPNCVLKMKSEFALMRHSIWCGKEADHYTIEEIPIPKSEWKVGCRKDARKVYVCNICSKKVIRKEYIHDHIIRNHLKLKLFDCTYCDMKFAHKTELRSHVRIHTDEKPFTCKLCGWAFRVSSALNGHMRSIHSDEKNYKCSHCQKMFKQYGNLMTHIKLHTKEKPYKCETCGEDFGRFGDLTRHKLKEHLNLRPYKCKVEGCGKGFLSNAELTMHKLAHSDVRPFSCDICDMAFKTNQKLVRHRLSKYHVRKSNSEVRSISCDICNLDFKKNSSLVRHRLTKYHVQKSRGKC